MKPALPVERQRGREHEKLIYGGMNDGKTVEQ
jgi:hypothetical protein